MRTTLWRLVMALFCALAVPALAASEEAPAEPKVIRAGGDYVVHSIEQQRDGTFVIEFKADHPSGRFDTLHLSSDHVHVGVRQGQKLRLSAEVVADKGGVAEVSQVVVFLPNATGPTPVWLLSNKTPPRDLRAVKYLEMHVPQNDYMVL